MPFSKWRGSQINLREIREIREIKKIRKIRESKVRRFYHSFLALSMMMCFGASLLLAPRAFAIDPFSDIEPFVDIGIGVAIIEDKIGEARYAPAPVLASGSLTELVVPTADANNPYQTRSFDALESNGLALSANIGAVFAKYIRGGVFFRYDVLTDEKFQVSELEVLGDETATAESECGNAACPTLNPIPDPAVNTDRTIADNRVGFPVEISVAHFITSGFFLGAHLSLEEATNLKHSIYLDYGFGYIYNISDIDADGTGSRMVENASGVNVATPQTYPNLNSSNYTQSSLTHMVRLGFDVPLPPIANLKGLGFGLETMWIEPLSSDFARIFSVTAKTSYRF